jgi:uncharacterized protein (UPF0548 family)
MEQSCRCDPTLGDVQSELDHALLAVNSDPRGENVAVLAHCFNCYWLNACRIVYLVEDYEPLQRFGFAYGTLEDHGESGEERFTVEWNRENDEVWYDLLAFSRPNQIMVRLPYPLARRLQKRFAADSKMAMVRAVGTS